MQWAATRGRPWPEVKPAVAEFYSRLSDETITWFLRAHHENLWPFVQAQVRAARDADSGLMLEGSALRPVLIADLLGKHVVALGLCAHPTFLRERIEREGLYDRWDEPVRLLIDRFIARSVRDNDQIVEDARRVGLRTTDAANPGEVERLYADLTAGLPDFGRNSSASRA